MIQACERSCVTSFEPVLGILTLVMIKAESESSEHILIFSISPVKGHPVLSTFKIKTRHFNHQVETIKNVLS